MTRLRLGVCGRSGGAAVLAARPLTGPEALKFPERGIGIAKFKERRQQMEDLVRQQQHQAQTAQYEEITEQIRKLGELHDQGVLTDEEFNAKKAELLSRL